MREAFERAIREHPDDLSGYAAYSDWLQEQGDPRGEFMAVQIALEDETLPKQERKRLQDREMELLEAHEAEWVGDWPEQFPAPTHTEGRGQINHTGGRKYEFRRGLLAVAHFGVMTVAAARRFVAVPQTQLVRELFIGMHAFDEEFEPGPDIPAGVGQDDDPADYIMLGWPHLRDVRRFQFGWQADEVYGDFCNFQCHTVGGRVSEYLKQMPRVEEVLLFAHFRRAEEWASLPMPNLRVLQLYHGRSYPLGRLAENPSLTNLTRLLCHPHALDEGDPYIRLPDLRAVCRSPHLTSLTHLRLRLADFGDDGVREVIASGVLTRLKELDFRHGCVTDEGARLLAACPDIRRLERLDLSRNRLTAVGLDALRATGVPAELGHQHAVTPDSDEEEQNRYLFEADYE